MRLLRNRRSVLRGLVTVGVAVGVAAGATVGVASAHVTADAGKAVKGGYGKVVFRVPTESKTAGTVKLQITLPLDHPIASARTLPVAGWTAQIVNAPVNPPITVHHTTVTEAPHIITWTAAPGTRLGPTEFGEFAVSMGTFPDDVDQLVFPAQQTYDDGTVVNWDQVQQPGQPEPEHPAPTVTLHSDTSGHHDGGHGGAPAESESEAQDASAASGADDTARWLGGAGLVVGALGLGLGIGAVARGRRRGGST
jgi:uncharacterized protein YcnI